MKVHLNSDTEIVQIIRVALKENDGYCPCVHNSKGKIEYKCMCKDFRENTKVGDTCHCGLYVKDSN